MTNAQDVFMQRRSLILHQLVHLVGFTIGIRYDARTYERQVLERQIHIQINKFSTV
jgi:hypothetical protein